MPVYQKGEKTKQAIIQTGRALFYSKGYIATYLNDIAEHARINPGVIHYHFKSKQNIATQIYSEFLLSTISTIDKFFPEESLEIKNAIELRIYWHLITTNKSFSKFLYEISLERIPNRISQNIGVEYFSSMKETFKLDIDDKMLKLLCLSSVGIETEMIIGFEEGYLNFSAKDFANYDIQTMFELLSIPYETINRILKRSEDCFSEIEVKLLPKFKLKIVKTKDGVQ